MFHKYNLVLRATEDAPEFMRAECAHLCRGNNYVTTQHVLNSAIIKLSKLTRVTKVYRGLASGGLPDAFWNADRHGVRGGVENAFMSTTTSRDVALKYAGGGSGGIVFEIEQGMVSRGADISWLSQYPHEKEIVFAPLAGIELRGTRVEGAVVVAEMAISVNLTGQTIE